jgi:uncharacterized protein YqjF (DUF2071 family)
LVLDTIAGESWIGVIPFDIALLAPRGAPGGLRLSFLKLNVRIYVTIDDKPGVRFFSLDAASQTAVRLARATSYYWAQMQMRHEDRYSAYSSHRSVGDASFRGRY